MPSEIGYIAATELVEKLYYGKSLEIPDASQRVKSDVPEGLIRQ
ncbi:MAG: hypothetical protein QOF32_1297 [Gammaproteobacteria bacterium]|nr:hypothetical protein [Gammaproteobacteria bacterium]